MQVKVGISLLNFTHIEIPGQLDSLSRLYASFKSNFAFQ